MPVALPRMTLNHRILRVERPRRKRGVDALPDVLHRDLRANFTETSEFTLEERVLLAEATGVFLIPAHDPHTGELVDLQAGDVLVWQDWRSVEQTSEVTAAGPKFVMSALSHLRVVIGSK